MRHMAFLRVYLPLDRLPERVHGLAQAAAKLSRADIDAEAAQRLSRRLRPDTFSIAPSSSEPPIIRVLEDTDPNGTTHQFFHVDYLERAAFESAKMRREFYDDQLYAQLVPQQTLDTLEKISEIQADAGLISRPVPNFNMGLWNVPLQWLAAFLGPPELPESRSISESIVDGTKVVCRIRDLHEARSQLGWLAIRLHHYGPDGPHHPYTRGIDALHRWLGAFDIRQRFQGFIELDYGALSRYAWPDDAAFILEDGHKTLNRVFKLETELEDEDPDHYTGLPPAMLEQAAEIMRTRYETAVGIWKRIAHYEYAN